MINFYEVNVNQTKINKKDLKKKKNLQESAGFYCASLKYIQ